MNRETRACQNCKSEFAIEPEDFAFYEKMRVPPPTWCPQCRLQRRLSFRNERTLYWRNCDLCGARSLSMYHPESPYRVYCLDCWWSDKWSPLDYGRDCNFSRSFFENFHELQKEVPRPATYNLQSVNCEYTNLNDQCKNSYMITTGYKVEDSMYSEVGVESREIFDSIFLILCEKAFWLADSTHSANVHFSSYVDNCTDSSFLFDCRNCHSCFGSVGLRNKSYVLFNRQLTREEYAEAMKRWDLGSYKKLSEVREQFREIYLSTPRKFAFIIRGENVTGNNIREAKNCLACFDVVRDVEDNKNVVSAGYGVKDCHDLIDAGLNCQRIYEGLSIGEGQNILMSSYCWRGTRDSQYLDYCFNAADCFGSMCLRDKKHCLLNKQYSKEDYENTIRKVIGHMAENPYRDKKGRIYTYGDFFPAELSPFAYNETSALEFFPLDVAMAGHQGWAWRRVEDKSRTVTVAAENLPDHIRDVSDNVLNQTIGCAHRGVCNDQCSIAFRVIPKELEFYRRMNFTLPRLCPNCRHMERIRARSPYKLWHRKCQCGGTKSGNGVYQNTAEHFHKNSYCPNEFETSYAPDRPEIIYCEACYQSEVV
ncbi:hypothetical protein HY504_01895 [Candidatus Wolfebacteria bacterium]|nr:hypothetical protein [Candidatus Wolfebacteria bacterium]